MFPNWQSGIINGIEQVTPSIRRYWIQLPETSCFDFKPGQFITLDLPISTHRNKRWRSYSIASMPDGGNIIELLIVHVPDGLATNYIFSNLNIGDTITLRGPQGVFCLPQTLDKDLFLICTGTGIAPFRSMLLYILHNKLSYKKIYLIFGSRTHEDLLYEQEMRDLENQLSGFSYIPTLSRQVWDGCKHGYVHPIYESLCANHQPASFLLCGWRAMIDEATERILKLGYNKSEIIHELYG